MPQISIPSTMDAQFLAKLADLKQAWGVLPGDPTQPDTQFIAFRTADLDAVEAAIEEYPEAYLAHRKAQRLEELAEFRRQNEIIGPMGLTLDDKTVLRLTAASTGLLIDTTRESLRWEMSRGVFQEIPRENVLALAVACVNKVQNCFDHVYAKTLEIQAITLDPELGIDAALNALNAIDLETGWPA